MPSPQRDAMPTGPFVIPVEPFDPERLALRAKSLNDRGVDWEFDWLTRAQAAEITPWLAHFGVIR